MSEDELLQEPTIAEQLADWAIAMRGSALPEEVADMCRRILLDVTGLCVAARETDYVTATLAATEDGTCTAFGHKRALDMYSAALVNGTAAHGEDFDDTFEGGPIHSGAVVIPAVLAACERFGRSGKDALEGCAVGIEIGCRLSLVAPTATHKAGFHPTAVIGCLSAALGVGTALGLDRQQMVWALGISGSMASGIIEYLADGSWTKRMHAGWAAQSGIRAALMAKGGFVGPVSVIEGTHGFFKAFAPSRKPDYTPLLDGLGAHWHMTTITFKSYACGTMTQPYVDCALELSQRKVKAEDIESIVCDVGEGTVHRLWEPLAAKRRPPTPYAAKFSTPYCVSVGFFDRAAGLSQFTEEKVNDAEILGLAAKVGYRIDPDNPYPAAFTGHLRVTMKDGSVIELRRAHMRGGAQEPLTAGEIEKKFTENALHGGWRDDQVKALKLYCSALFDASDLAGLAAFRA